MGDNSQLGDLMLTTLPQHCHEVISSSIEDCGPVETFFTKVFYLWTEEQKRAAMEEVFNGQNTGGKYRTILVDCLKMNNTLRKYETHKHFIEKTYQRFKHHFEHLDEDQIKHHYNSKADNLLELVGYTARWEWGLDCSVWREALQHHYQHNPHHPQHYPGQPMEQRYLEESVVDMIGMKPLC